MIYTLSNGIIELSVQSRGGSMTSIKYLGEERQWQGNEFWNSQDVVIFPLVGHIGDYEVDGKIYTAKSHGVARYAEFSLVEKSDTALTLAISSDDETKKTYPYDFDFKISYELIENTVKITYFVRAKHGEIPFYVGGHPGMQAPDGEAVIEFENEECPIFYPLKSGEPVQMKKLKSFFVDKEFFGEKETFQLGNLSGIIHAITNDGYRYTYKSECPVWAFWSNDAGGDYICVEPWWGINDHLGYPMEIKRKHFINFANEKWREFSYSLTINKTKA